MLYLSADDDAKETIKQADNLDTLDLEGTSSDKDLKDLIESIMDIISTGAPVENIQREFEMLSAIQNWKRRPSDNTGIFSTR